MRLLAEALGLHEEPLGLVAGRTRARKIIEIFGLTQEKLRRRLDRALAGGAAERRP